jgi:two-component system sensor histidine kinase/response regulator
MATVLIVDDDPDFTLVSRTVLEDAGYETRAAANGSQALQMMREERPDVVLLDVMMSTTLEGVDVSKTMESDPNLKDVPIIMVSSIATTEYASDFPDGEAIPIHAWISKPIQPKVLLNVVKRFVD